MYKEIYIDLVFATNLLMDFVLLRLTGTLLGARASWRRSLLGALIGSLTSCLILIIPTDNPCPAFLLHALTAALMAKTGCKVKSKSMLAMAAVTLYILAFLCGGFWDVLSAGGGVALKTFLIFTGVSYAFLAICVKGYRKWNQKGETVCQVLLKTREKTLTVTGFYDTGNLLTDPLTNKPVSIVEERVLAELLPDAALNGLKNMEEAVGEYDDPLWESLHPHFIFFRSVGEHAGALPAITLEEMCIYRGEQIIYVYHPVIAVSSTPFHAGEKYQILLNGQIA